MGTHRGQATAGLLAVKGRALNGHGGLISKGVVAAGVTGTRKTGKTSRDQTNATTTVAVVSSIPA